MEIKNILKQIPLFQNLSSELIEELAPLSSIVNYNTGDKIIQISEKGRLFGAVITGEFRVEFTATRVNEQSYMSLKSGDYFGIMSILTDEPIIKEIIALSESSVLLMPQDALYRVMLKEKSLTNLVAGIISSRLDKREKDDQERKIISEVISDQDDPYGLNKFSIKDGGKILTINCGSSSLKYCVFNSKQHNIRLEGHIEKIGKPGTLHIYKKNNDKIQEDIEDSGYKAAFNAMITAIGGYEQINEIKAVGHRVVHGGEKYQNTVIIDKDVIKGLKDCENLAPLHIPANVIGIEEAMNIMPEIPHVAVFDTGFHKTIPKQAFVYGLPIQFYNNEGIRRYGFHGTSHKYVCLKASAFLKRPFNELKIISCHLGNGASVAAVDHGQCIDTSMGMTPLEGLIMGTRSGDVDPGAVLYLMKKNKLSPEEMENILMKKSGLLGLSGVSNDMREIIEAADKGNPNALLAIQVFCYRIKKYIGAFRAALGGLDVLIFTGGIGENSTEIRARACQNLSGLGIIIDDDANRNPELGKFGAALISSSESAVKVLVVPTDEERMIAVETAAIVNNTLRTENVQDRDRAIPIGVSAHHVHLCREHVEALYGKGHKLTYNTPLSQPGQFTCKEQVTLVGPKGKVERVRILGPERDNTQVEISRTEEFKLGIDAPIRMSGDLEGTPGLILETDNGRVTLDKGVICAMRHIHMTPEDALGFGLRDKDVVMIKVEGERELIFGDVVVRVSPKYKLEFHIDTDEANAAELNTGMAAKLFAVQSG